MAELGDFTAQCIRCGFCLEACPTFQLTADESQSPRGRITLARTAVESGEWPEATAAALDSCLGCRACETACPSGVPYGKILELAREETNRATPRRTGARKRLLDATTHPILGRLQFAFAGLLPGRKVPEVLSRLVSGAAAEATTPVPQDVPDLPGLEEAGLPQVRGEVYLLEGCVMRVLYPDVHWATRRLLRRVGYVVRESGAGCCGALHAHSGYLAEAEERAQALGQAFDDAGLPVVVNSAGCGSTLKEYGSVVGRGLAGIAGRTVDLTEFLLQAGLVEALRGAPGLPGVTAAYHDACHLAHGQKVRAQPRELLRAVPGLTLVELPEADMCCGSAGTYNLFQPELARRLLERKWANVEATGADAVVSGNPGCHAWIGQAAAERGSKVRVFHTATILEAAFSPGLV